MTCSAALAPWVTSLRWTSWDSPQYSGYRDMAWTGDDDHLHWTHGSWRVGESWDESMERSQQ